MTFEQADQEYPYNPHAREHVCHGLEKLRCFEAPGMRRAVYEGLTMTREQRAPAGYVSWDEKREQVSPDRKRLAGGDQ